MASSSTPTPSAAAAASSSVGPAAHAPPDPAPPPSPLRGVVLLPENERGGGLSPDRQPWRGVVRSVQEGSRGVRVRLPVLPADLADPETIFLKTDADFLESVSIPYRQDGSTALTAVLVGDQLYVANVGDSRAIA